jgi:hypothetical protein
VTLLVSTLFATLANYTSLGWAFFYGNMFAQAANILLVLYTVRKIQATADVETRLQNNDEYRIFSEAHNSKRLDELKIGTEYPHHTCYLCKTKWLKKAGDMTNYTYACCKNCVYGSNSSRVTMNV